MVESIKKDYFGTFEVAKYCQVSPASVSRWIKSGTVKASTTVGGHKRISRDELIKLIKTLKLPVPVELAKESGIKVLVIDDEPIMRKLLKVSLAEDFENLAIEEAEDGFQAGVKLMSFLPDLVTLDIKLPGVDGHEICKVIRKSPELSHTKIIAISGQTDKDTKDRIIKAGADAFFPKPVQHADLRLKILELFEGNR